MNEIVRVVNNKAVTDSVALAEGSGNEHKAVIQLVRNYQADLEEFGGVTFEMAPFVTAGGTQTREIALLNEHQATLLLTYMRNTKRIRTFKKQLVKAFFAMAEKLHSKATDPMTALNDPAAMRGLLLTYTEKVLALEEEKKMLTPKAEALDRIATAEGNNCITDTAKVLQVRPKDLFGLLSSERWIYRRPGGKGWIAYQDKIQQGLLTHKVTTVLDIHTGREKVIEHVLVTPKGLAKLAGKVEEVAA